MNITSKNKIQRLNLYDVCIRPPKSLFNQLELITKCTRKVNKKVNDSFDQKLLNRPRCFKIGDNIDLLDKLQNKFEKILKDNNIVTPLKMKKTDKFELQHNGSLP